MELYLIEKSTLKTTPKGKTLKEIELTDGLGKAISTTAWLNPSENDEWFNSIKEGDEVGGIITKAGYFASTMPSKTRTNAPRSYGSVKDDVSASHMISDAMTRKENSIKSFVDKKEQGMIYFASLREAGNYMISMTGVVSALDEEGYHKEFWKQHR